MIYKVVIMLSEDREFVMYEGSNQKTANDAWLAAKKPRKYYVGTIVWEEITSKDD